MTHGATIGITDDEAYYWVLAQKPALGYAYHPPMIAWLIALSQALFGPIFGRASAFVVRFPAALCTASVLALALRWLQAAGVARDRLFSSAAVLVSLAGLFALSWMMVPDLPLFLGWMLAFQATWDLCFTESAGTKTALLLLLGTTLSLLSKYSAVLIGFSCLVAVFLWMPKRHWAKAIGALFIGGILAAIPIVIWNASHEWASILYQIRDRQEGGSFSLVRWLRFWAIEIFAGGPALVVFSFAMLLGVIRGKADRTDKFLWLFAGPAAGVFFIQPLWADFKPHWALVVWWPMAMGLARAWGLRQSAWARWQMRYGLTLGAIVLICCHVPVVQYAIYSFNREHADPRLDVTNDLYGWHKLRAFLKSQPGNEDLSTPVLGGRYQTASQAWFALGARAKVSMLPLDVKSRDEWPDLGVTKSLGPDWSKDWSELQHTVYFVADNRYDAPPEFPHAKCLKAGRVSESRAGYPAKWIDVWKCDPSL
jgi:dolichol-phosphate mannosyltransferase